VSDERRQHPRVAAEGTCVIRDEQGVDRPFELVDLSECGARLKCSIPIGAMTRIRVQMQLPGDRVGRAEDARLATVGVIVWSHRIADGVYDTGVFFPELAEDQASLLQAYVLSSV
jgi:hypothetical protein